MKLNWLWFRPKRLQPLIDRIAQLEVETTILRERAERYSEEMKTVALTIKPLVDAMENSTRTDGGIVKVEMNTNLLFRLRFAKHYCEKFHQPGTKHA